MLKKVAIISLRWPWLLLPLGYQSREGMDDDGIALLERDLASDLVNGSENAQEWES